MFSNRNNWQFDIRRMLSIVVDRVDGHGCAAILV